MKINKVEPQTAKKAEITESLNDETTVVSWGAFSNDPNYYQFPPGLKGIKEVTKMGDNVVVLMNDGTLNGWYVCATGGRTTFLQHLSKLKNVTKIVWGSELGFFRQLALYIWSLNGACELHKVKVGSSSDEEKIEVVPLGYEIVDVITGRRGDLVVHTNGEVILMNSGSKNEEDLFHLRNLISKINSEPSKRLLNYKKGYLFTGGCSNSGATILWLDNKGLLHFEIEGKPERDYQIKGELSLPKKLQPVDDIVPEGVEYGVNFILLRNGKVTALDLYNSIETEIEESTAINSLKSPIKKIKLAESGPGGVMAFSESGRVLLVTTRKRPNKRDCFKRKSISPVEINILDAVVSDSGFIAIATGAHEESRDLNENLGVNPVARELYVWGKGYVNQRVETARKPKGLGKVFDVAVFWNVQIGSSGWICVREDGSLFGLDAYFTQATDIIPPWFPTDFIAIKAEGGFRATRKNGEIWVWGSSKVGEEYNFNLCRYTPVSYEMTLGEFEEYKSRSNTATDHLAPPEELKKCSKALKVGDLVVAIGQ